MSQRLSRPPSTARRRRLTGGGLVVVALTAALIAVPGARTADPVAAADSVRRLAERALPTAAGRDGLGADDGFIAKGESVSPFADDLPAIAELEPGLRDAIRQAARDARAAGIEMVVTSGWRSAAFQRSLMDDAVRQYGSRAEAERFVLSPEKSAHVTGQAVDVGHTDAAYWLGQRGTAYGLCQTYANEVWHFERVTEPGGTCPAPLGDATQR